MVCIFFIIWHTLKDITPALIDMIVTEHLFYLYPQATSGQLSWMRSRAVCCPSLTLIAIRELHLHKFHLLNSPELQKEIAHYVNILGNCSYSDMTDHGWKYDPPKAISDLTESVFGAMFIDSGCDYEQLKSIVLQIFKELMTVITPDLPKDPAAELLVWVTKNGCRRCHFR
jgi:endoribonuclease Dicer